MPKIASFFAGIGGFDLAFEREGFKTVYQCEIDRFCNRILEKHWPALYRQTDICKVKVEDLPDADIWCGGFPCQDVSVARGSKGRAGLKGSNSGLFFPFLNLIREKKPKVLLLENVVGLLSSHQGQDFLVILEELTALGYSVCWRIMNSRYFGAPQSRPRVFICASLGDPELPLRALFEEIEGAETKLARSAFLDVHACKKSGALVPGVAYCLAATSGRHTGTDWSRTYISYDSAVRRLTPGECEGIQGFPRDWTLLPALNESVDIDSPRYKALGNAVAVPVVGWIARRLKKAMRSKLRLHNGFTVDHATSAYPDFSRRSRRIVSFSDLKDASLRWQSGGYARKGFCIDVKAPEAPSVLTEIPLLSVIEKKIPAEHYYLTPNAAEGILRRVDSQNRTLFGPMDAALRLMVRTAKSGRSATKRA